MNVMTRLPRSVYAFICQGLVSGATFLSSLAVLHYGTRDSYAAFVLFINAYMLLASLQNAIFLSPLVTLAPRMSAHAIETALTIGLQFTMLLALLGGVGLMIYLTRTSVDGLSLHYALIVIVGFGLLLRRDVLRSIWLLLGDVVRLLQHDTVYFLLAVFLLLLAFYFERIAIDTVIVAVAAPALIGLLMRSRIPIKSEVAAIDRLDANFWSELWACARWALPGVVVTWLFSNGYWFYIDAVQGKAAIALLAATRLFFTPVGLMIQGWAGYYRPVFAILESQQRHEEKRQIVRKQIVYATLIVATFAGALLILTAVAGSVIPRFIDRTQWTIYVIIWALYFTIQWSRTVISTSLLANPIGYRWVFKGGLVGCLIFYAVFLPVTAYSNNPVYCPLILILAELVIYMLLRRKSHG